MGIYNKGMEMPKEGGLRVLCVYGDGSIRMPVWGKGLVKAEYMQASELPPHGRLIDADQFKSDECGICDGCCETFNGNECSMCQKEGRCDFMKDIDDAPTIIEAEVKE